MSKKDLDISLSRGRRNNPSIVWLPVPSSCESIPCVHWGGQERWPTSPFLYSRPLVDMSMHTEKGKETIRLQKLVNNARIEHSTYTVILARLVAYKWEQGSPAFRVLLISILSARINTVVKSDCDKRTSTVVVMWCTYLCWCRHTEYLPNFQGDLGDYCAEHKLPSIYIPNPHASD